MTTSPEHSPASQAFYRIRDVDVAGGLLRVGLWEPATLTDRTPTILALHGITGSHLAWLDLAAALPEVRVVAPDLRGRGRSNALRGPYGMMAHLDDLRSVLDSLKLSRVVLVGHSMGAFVATMLAHREPHRVSKVVLVDGGLPRPVPSGLTPEERMSAVLGPAAERLARTYRDRDDYRAFWREHPALTDDWTENVASYVDYDLTGSEPELRPSAHYPAVVQDFTELLTGGSVLAAVDGLQHSATMLWAPRGLMDEVPGLYTAEEVAGWERRIPGLSTRAVDNVNHYTIAMSRRGAAAVASAVRSEFHDTGAGSRLPDSC